MLVALQGPIPRGIIIFFGERHLSNCSKLEARRDLGSVDIKSTSNIKLPRRKLKSRLQNILIDLCAAQLPIGFVIGQALAIEMGK